MLLITDTAGDIVSVRQQRNPNGLKGSGDPSQTERPQAQANPNFNSRNLAGDQYRDDFDKSCLIPAAANMCPSLSAYLRGNRETPLEGVVGLADKNRLLRGCETLATRRQVVDARLASGCCWGMRSCRGACWGAATCCSRAGCACWACTSRRGWSRTFCCTCRVTTRSSAVFPLSGAYATAAASESTRSSCSTRCPSSYQTCS